MPLQVDQTPYRGRFAPTPSGPLHLGSLLTALASWLAARSVGGAWLLRLDDLDAPRCPPGAAAEILRQLEAHGLRWDEAVRYQSQHVDAYRQALEPLASRNLTYRCTCSRVLLAQTSHPGPDGPVYAGTCALKPTPPGRAATRLRLGDGTVTLVDRWAGLRSREVSRDIGDVVVLRSDGQVAYQWACVVDDEAQGITEVVRGADLLGSSLQQAALMRMRGQTPPRYGHLPVITDVGGRKLSKQNHAAPIDSHHASANLLGCLTLLGLSPESALSRARPAEVLEWALAHGAAASLAATAQSGDTITYNAVQQTGFFP